MSVLIPNTKQVSFFHGLITALVRDHRVYDTDLNVVGLRNRLKAAMGRDDNFMLFYADCVINTVDLEFRFDTVEGGVPEPYRSVEDFWRMVRTGMGEVECFKFFTEHVPSVLLLGVERDTTLEEQLDGAPKLLTEVKGWTQAIVEAQTIWKPAAEKLAENRSAAEAADPLLNSATKHSSPAS